MISEILNKLYSIDHIPTHPLLREYIERASRSVNFTDSTFLKKFSRDISFDPSLSFEFLKIANAGSFGYQRKVSSVEQALLVLDPDLISLIIEQHPVTPEMFLYKSMIKNYLLIIKHSIEVRIIVQNLLEGNLINIITSEEEKNDLISTSILHDIGLLFTLLYFPEEYKKASPLLKNITTGKNDPFPDHAFIGSVLCEYWHLPYWIRTAIAFHHYPWLLNNGNETGAEILYISDSLSSTYYELYFGKEDIYSIEEHIIMKKHLIDIIEKFNINITDLAMIREEAIIHTEKIMTDLGLNSPVS